MQKLTLKIADFHCPACVLRLEGIEDDLEGISEAKASYTQQTLEVTFDEALLDREKIIAAIQKIGYNPAPAD